jgi:putative ABC transport system ATP-binding protein
MDRENVTDDQAETVDLPARGRPGAGTPEIGMPEGRDTQRVVAGRDRPSAPVRTTGLTGTTAGSTPATTTRPTRAAVALPGGAQILCEGVVKIYKVADLEVVALQGLDLLVEAGEFVALIGASGSGKSTLMNILGGLDVPSAGRALVAGHDLGDMGRRERTQYRRNVIGFVWQQTARNLLPYLTARQNVELPMLLNGVGKGERERRAADLLGRVGLTGRGDHEPGRLSGGEQQRVAIAVALANEPSVLFADEPTGELDTATAHEVFDLLRSVNQEMGVTIVVVTHDPLVSEQVRRTIAIRDGRTSSETLRRRAINEEGDHHIIAEEYAVLDRVGRLQLPRAHVEALGLERRVRLALEPDHISVWPDQGRSGDGDGDDAGGEPGAR